MRYLSEIISCIALLVSLLVFLENRRNSRIGHAPAIIGHEREGPVDYSYAIQNKGRGPAFFEKVEYFLDQKLLGNVSLRDALAKVLAENGIHTCKLTVTHPAQQNVMQPGEEIVLVKLEVREEDAPKLKSIPAARFAVRVTFKSAHGKKLVWASNDRVE